MTPNILPALPACPHLVNHRQHRQRHRGRHRHQIGSPRAAPAGAQAELQAATTGQEFRMLDDVFSAFDSAVEKYGLFKYQHVRCRLLCCFIISFVWFHTWVMGCRAPWIRNTRGRFKY